MTNSPLIGYLPANLSGSQVKVVAPGTADTTIANVAISLKGTL